MIHIATCVLQGKSTNLLSGVKLQIRLIVSRWIHFKAIDVILQAIRV